MKKISPRLLNIRVDHAIALLILSALVTPNALAKTRSEPPTQKASVIAHLPLPGTPVSQLLLRQQGSKQYLYIQQTATNGFTVVDVTQPDRPNVVKDVTLPGKGSDEKLDMLGNGVALAETPDSSATGGTQHALSLEKSQAGNSATVARTETIRVLDLSDPKNPRTLQTFDGVTKVMADDVRNLIYITNGEGLWILRHNPNVESKKRPLPPCDSESVFSPMVDCQ
ncbi:MAG TPA: hypothetical protein VK763_10110 [Terriglobales bacterium]|jgi:hypothetical protein|nr:hypothetical protein [Terriglobales bacterium]